MVKQNLNSPPLSLAPLSNNRKFRPLESDPAPAIRSTKTTASSRISLAQFVGIKFLPEYIERKSFAGRRHYQSMLKHILRPETVDQLFNPGAAELKSRLKAVTDWPYLDEVKLCELKEHHVRDLTAAAFAQGYSAQTVTHIRNVLGVIIAHAKREGLFAEESPVPSIELPPISHNKQQDLTIAQAKTMLKMMQYPERQIALIAITTGISIREICGLQWKHINITTAAIDCDGDTIPSGCILLKQYWSPQGIANLHSTRIRLIEVSEPILFTLQRLKQEARFATANSFVMATSSGTPIRPDTLRMMRLKVIGRKISIPWLSWRVVRRAHEAMVTELRDQLNTDLVSSASG
jgi:site-specific recombinase XerD